MCVCLSVAVCHYQPVHYSFHQLTTHPVVPARAVYIHLVNARVCQFVYLSVSHSITPPSYQPLRHPVVRAHAVYLPSCALPGGTYVSVCLSVCVRLPVS